MEFSRQEYWSGLPFPSPGDPPNPEIELRSPALQADSLPAEPQGKAKNTGVGSLSLLQQIFPIQESNRDLLHFRQILYQLSSQGSPQDCTSPSQILETGTVNPSNGCGDQAGGALAHGQVKGADPYREPQPPVLPVQTV